MYEPVYEWVDQVPLTRVRKNFARDFSDGCLLAEVVKHFRPTLVDLHNYRESLSAQRKKENWVVLNQKVLKKIGVDVDKHEIELLCSGTDNAAEKLLQRIQKALESGPPAPPKRRVAKEAPEAPPAPLDRQPKRAKPQGGGAKENDAAKGGERAIPEGGMGGKPSAGRDVPAGHATPPPNRPSPANRQPPGPIAGKHAASSGQKAEQRPGAEFGAEPDGPQRQHQQHQKGYGGEDDSVRRLLLDMAHFNLGQFDLHDEQRLHMQQGRRRVHASAAAVPGEARGGDGDERLPPVSDGAVGRGERRAIVKELPPPGGGRGRGNAGVSPPSSKIVPGAMIKGASPVKNLMARGTGESPQKLRGRLAGREAERRDEEDEERDAKSRDLMRDSELALAEVRNVYGGLEKAIKELERTARAGDVLPLLDNDGTSGLWEDAHEVGRVYEYPWFN